MSLLICPECGKKVSDKASNCPHCGFPIEEIDKQPTESVESKVQALKSSILTEDVMVVNEESNVQPSKSKQGIKLGILICSIMLLGMIFIIQAAIRYTDNTKYTVDEAEFSEVIEDADSKILIMNNMYGYKLNTDGTTQLPEGLLEMSESLELFGFDGSLWLEGVGTDFINTIHFKPIKELSDEEYDFLLKCLSELYGEPHSEYDHEEWCSYGWKDVQGYSAVALQKHAKEDKVQTYVVFQRMDTVEKEDTENLDEKYGVEQMVGYDSLIALPADSPVTVSGIAQEVSSGIYLMEIFTKDIKDIHTDDDIEYESIYIFDLEPKISYDKRYISVNGHTRASDDLPIVVAEEIVDESENYISNGGTLPE